jgi:hypothetical protein
MTAVSKAREREQALRGAIELAARDLSLCADELRGIAGRTLVPGRRVHLEALAGRMDLAASSLEHELRAGPDPRFVRAILGVGKVVSIALLAVPAGVAEGVGSEWYAQRSARVSATVESCAEAVDSFEAAEPSPPFSPSARVLENGHILVSWAYYDEEPEPDSVIVTFDIATLGVASGFPITKVVVGSSQYTWVDARPNVGYRVGVAFLSHGVTSETVWVPGEVVVGP